MTEKLALWLQLYEMDAGRTVYDAGRNAEAAANVTSPMQLLAAAFALFGITLGSPAGGLRDQLGDPLIVETTSKISRTADYLRSDDPSAVLRVTEREGVVFAVELERERPETTTGLGDDYGVTLGMTRAAVKVRRGAPAFETENTLLYPENPNEDASIVYRFDVYGGDIVEAIKLVGSGATAAGNSALPQLADPAGNDYAGAILDLSPGVLVSDHYRDRYLTVHGCAPGGRTSTLDHRAGRVYAIATATCADKKRTFYFDVTRSRRTPA